MECRKVQQLLDAFAADELEAAQRQTIERHLAQCPVCRKEAQALRQTISLLGQFKEIIPPAVFLQELRQRMEKRQRRGILDRLLPRPVFARVLAAVSCLLVVGFGVWLVVKQLVPSTKVQGHYAGDKLGGDRLALLDSKEKSLQELPRTIAPSRAVARTEGTSVNGDIPAGEVYFEDGALRQESRKYAVELGRPAALPDAEARETTSRDTRFGSAERPAEPPRAPAATTASLETAVAGYAVQPEGRERLAGKTDDREARGVASKAAAAKPTSESLMPRDYESAKGERAPTINAEQMAQEVTTGEELRSEEKSQIASLLLEREKARALRARASQEDKETSEGDQSTTSARRHAAEVPTEEALGPGATLQVQRGKMGKSDVDFLAEELTVPVAVINGAEADSGNMIEQGGREQKDSALERWHFYGLGNLVTGYDRSDSPTPELILVVRDIAQARAEIQKAVTEVGGSAQVATEKKSTTEPDDEGEQERFRADRSFPLSDSSAGLLLRDGRTDLLIVRLKAGTYETFRQKLLPHRAGVVSGPQPSRGTEAIPAEEAPKQEGEMTLLIRLVEISQQQSQETQSPQTLQPTP